ncbi:hypothetical protein AAMO2058_000949600 [Amorphochlora amoebiformis]
MRRRPSQSAQRVQNQGVLAGLALLLVLMAPEPRRCIRFLAITHPNAKKRGANDRDSKGARLQSKVVAAEKLSHSIREMQRKLEDMQNEILEEKEKLNSPTVSPSLSSNLFPSLSSNLTLPFNTTRTTLHLTSSSASAQRKFSKIGVNNTCKRARNSVVNATEEKEKDGDTDSPEISVDPEKSKQMHDLLASLKSSIINPSESSADSCEDEEAQRVGRALAIGKDGIAKLERKFEFKPPAPPKPRIIPHDVETGDSTANLTAWLRPAGKPFNSSEPLTFMVTSIYGHDIDLRPDAPPRRWDQTYGRVPFQNKRKGFGRKEEIDEERRDEYTVRVFGVTAHGTTVGATLRYFKPYFYVLVPEELQESWHGEGVEETDSSANDGFMEDMKQKKHVNTTDHTSLFTTWLRRQLDTNGWSLAGARLVFRKKLFPFTNRRRFKFLKLKFRSEVGFRKAKDILSRAVSIPEILQFRAVKFDLYEGNVNPTMRFTQAADILTAGWVTLDEYVVPGRSQTRSEIDVMAHWRCMKSFDRNDIAPVVIASFDIEVQSSKARDENSKAFPNAINIEDTVSQIGTTLWRYGSNRILKHVVSLPSPKDKTVGEVSGVHVEVAMNEGDLIEKWVRFINLTNPDGFTGYNIFGFDWRYLMDRDTPHRQMEDGEFCAGPKRQMLRLLSRIKVAPARPSKSQLKSSAYGVNQFEVLEMPGRFQIDLLPYFRREHKLESYKLDYVAEHFTGQRKDDLPPIEIFRKLGGSAKDVATVAKYCAQDSALVVQLVRQQQIVPNLVEMAKVTRVPLDWLITRGQQVKVFAQIVHECQLQGFCVPTWPRQTRQASSESFVGATVLKANRGAYMERPVAGLDFASLYPSIMIAHNIDYTSIVLDDSYNHLPGVEYETISWIHSGKNHSYTFVQNQKGILPSLLEKLWKFRKQAKKDMRLAGSRGDNLQEAIYNGKQLAIKVSMNSIYGFTGAVAGMLPCKPIAASVTTWGRVSIEKSKILAEKGWPDLPKATVVYGDTDSIYTIFDVNMSQPNAMDEVFRVSIEAAKRITKIFKKPMELEFEKVFFPFMLFTKKRYAGLVWESPKTPKKLDFKGIQVVRRDSCKFVREICKDCFEDIMYRMDVDSAVQKARTAVENLLADPPKVPIEKLILSKSLHDVYKSDVLPHVKLAEKMRKRDPMNAPKAGDRVPFVFVEGTGLQHERVEDPTYAVENKVKIDGLYYLQHQLQNPLETVFELLLRDVAQTLWKDAERQKSNEKRGDHTITDWFKFKPLRS